MQRKENNKCHYVGYPGFAQIAKLILINNFFGCLKRTIYLQP